MHHHRFTYSEAERRKRQNPEALLHGMGLQPGMCFVDLGCNDGFFTLPAARIVGPNGKVIALDIDEAALGRLTEKLQSEHIQNVEVVASTAEAFDTYSDCADIVFFGMVLHDFQDPVQVLRNAKRMLHKDGFMYDYDWKKQPSELGPPLAIRLSPTQVAALAQKAELHVTAAETVDDNFYAVTMRLG